MLQNPWVQNVCAIALVAILLFSISTPLVFLSFIILGKAHFALTYFYQKQAGKITKNVIFLQILALGLLFIIARPERYPWFLLMAGSLFAVHFFQDEIKLFGKVPNAKLFLAGMAMAMGYFGFLADAVFSFHILPVSLLVGIILFFLSLALSFFEKTPFDTLQLYFGFILIIFCLLWIFSIHLPLPTLLGSVLLLHYTRWYIYYFWKVKPNTLALRKYLSLSLAINIAVFAVYFASITFHLLSPMYLYLYSPLYFYIWAILHIVFSFRKSDYAFFF